MKIIDADGHILDKEKDIRAHLPEAHRGRGSSLVPSLGGQRVKSFVDRSRRF